MIRLLNNCIQCTKNKLTVYFCGYDPTLLDCLPEVCQWPQTLFAASEKKVEKEAGDKI